MASGDSPKPEEMRDEFLKRLYEQRGELKGVALVQALKALAAMFPPEPPKPDEADEDKFSILDRVDALPKAHARKLLKQEISRISTDLDLHVLALKRLEGG